MDVILDHLRDSAPADPLERSVDITSRGASDPPAGGREVADDEHRDHHDVGRIAEWRRGEDHRLYERGQAVA